MQLEQTFMHFLLKHQQAHGRTLNFLILMEAIITAANYIQHYYNLSALHGNIGESGEINIQGEKVMRLDDMAHKIVMHYLTQSDQVLEATSEEAADPARLNDRGRYLIYFDPLDGSSNIKHSLPVGFLFGIAKRNLEGEEDFHIRAGNEFIAAGMFLLPAGIFTFALKNAGAWQFLRDENSVYIRPRRVLFPQSKASWELSWNTSNRATFADNIQRWLSANEANYNFRYAGSLVVDLHRLLHNGGLFLYPAILKHRDSSKNRPQGKLRLVYESAVAAFIAKEAGGGAIDEAGRDILDIQPKNRHERSTLYIGNSEIIADLKSELTAG